MKMEYTSDFFVGMSSMTLLKKSSWISRWKLRKKKKKKKAAPGGNRTGAARATSERSSAEPKTHLKNK